MVRQFPIHNLPALAIGGLFAVVFAAMGVQMGLSVLVLAATELRMLSWHETDCTIQDVQILEAGEPERPFDRFRISYKYRWNNVEHLGTKVSWLNGYDGQHFDTQQMFANWDQLRRDVQPTRCWVNAGYPEQSVLIRHARWDLLTWQVLVAMAFSGGCIWRPGKRHDCQLRNQGYPPPSA